MKKTKIKGREFYMSEVYPPFRPSVHDTEETSPALEHEERIIRGIDDYFWKGFSLLQMNKVAGAYVEFGCGATVRSTRIALKYCKSTIYPRRRMFLFDSFQGLPEPTDIDKHPQWIKGDMAVSEERFHALLARHGAEKGADYVCVPGFFDATLKGRTPASFGINQAAFVHVDCDLYSSTMDVLQFILPAMPDGAILSFDDWLCFNGNPDRGEQRAFREISEKFRSTIQFIPFRSFTWHGASFIVHRLDNPEAVPEIDELREQIGFILATKKETIRSYDKIVIYGTGSHSTTLLQEWKKHDLPAISAATNTETPGGGSFEGIPLVALKALKKGRQLVVLSSRSFEAQMFRKLTKTLPGCNVLSIWDPKFTRL